MRAARDREAVTAANAQDGDNLSPLTLVRVAKARHMASRDGLLYFVGAEHRFRELAASEMPPKARDPTTRSRVRKDTYE